MSNDWQEITDSSPNEREHVLLQFHYPKDVGINGESVCTGYRRGDQYFMSDDTRLSTDSIVTHWMSDRA